MSDYIPPEVISKILSKLPIADVLRSTSVCKSWYKLITSPSFISLHVNSSVPNTENRVILTFDPENDLKEAYYLHRNNQNFEIIKELKPPRKADENVIIYGSSNGLFCCSGDESVDIRKGKELFLWNPSLRKSLFLPKVFARGQQSVGFGFLPSSNNFKVVSVLYTRKNADGKFNVPPRVEVYEFLTRSWHDVNAAGCPYVLEYDRGQALMNGKVHWPALNPHRFGGRFSGLIVSFDLTTEQFGTLMLPKAVQNAENVYFFSVHTWKESLWLLHHSSIYVMKEYGVTNSWEKYLKFDFIDFMPIYLRENGEILAGLQSHEKFNCWSLVTCDPKTNRIRKLGLHKHGQLFRDAFAYVDSLFLI